MWIEIAIHCSMDSQAFCHPPCEDVDWNYRELSRSSEVAKSSSVWGCGLKCVGLDNTATPITGHPPCEDVDWNKNNLEHANGNFVSPSTWGCGLKYFCGVPTLKIYVTLCVRCGLKSANCSSNIRFWRVALRAKTVPVFFVCTMTAACIFYNMPLYTYYVYKGIYTIGSGKYFLYKYKKSLW